MRRKPKGIPPIPIKVKESTAVRAIYVAGEDELNKLSLTFTATDGKRYEAELNLTDAGRLISQMKVAYTTALPKHYREIH